MFEQCRHGVLFLLVYLLCIMICVFDCYIVLQLFVGFGWFVFVVGFGALIL